MSKIQSRTDKHRRMKIVALVVMAHLGISAHGQEEKIKSAATPYSVEVCGLRIIGTCFPSSPGQSRNGGMGTSISLLVTSNEGRLLKFDPNASAVTTFADDRGTDLMARNRRSGFSLFDTRSPVVEGDGKSAVIEIRTWELPLKGAQALTIEGELVFKQAATLDKVRAPTNLETGATANAGPFAVKVLKSEVRPVGDPHLGESRKSVQIEITGPDTDAVETVQLLNPSGMVLSQYRGHSMARQNERTSCTFALAVEKHISSGTIEIAYWSDAKEVKIAFSLDASLGL